MDQNNELKLKNKVIQITQMSIYPKTRVLKVTKHKMVQFNTTTVIVVRIYA